MAQQSSGVPQLDQYNQDGIVTPFIQRTLDAVKQRLPQFVGLPAPSAPLPQFGMPRNLVPQQGSPAPATPQLQLPGQQVPSISRGQEPPPASPWEPSGPPLPAGQGITDQGSDAAHLANRNRMITEGPGYNKIHNPVAHGLLKVLSTIGDTLVPQLTMNIPGTGMHHYMDVHDASSTVNQDTARAKENAETKNLEAQPELNATKAELAASKEAELGTYHAGLLGNATQKEKDTAAGRTANTEASLRRSGFKTDPDTGKVVPLSYAEMSESEQGIHDLKAAQAEQAAATAQLREAQAKNQPAVAAMAQKRLDSAGEAHQIALRRLGLSEKTFEARYRGTENGEALPGTVVGADGKPVGSAFQANVAPTSATRTKIASAENVKEQGQSMTDFAKDPKNSHVFGKTGGLAAWAAGKIGTDDPALAGIGAQIESMASFLTTMHGARGAALAEGFKKTLQNKNSPEAFAEATRQFMLGAERLEKSGAAKVTGGAGDQQERGGQGGTQGGKVSVVAPDGKAGTWDLSKGPIPDGFKKAGQ